jgi:glycosyltransferase involved in cell wall biosynthesis
MRIAIVTRARAPYLRDLQEAFAQEIQPGELHLLWPSHEPSDFKEDSTTPKGPNLRIYAIEGSPTLGDRFPSPNLWHQLDAIQPDLVWIHEFSPFTLAGLLYAKRRQLAVIESTEVGRGNAHFFSTAVRAWHFLWGHLVDGVIANAPAARQPLAGEARPVIDAFHAVDSRRFQPSPGPEDQPVTFVAIGKLIPRKGSDLLLQAAARLRETTDADFRIRFVGANSDD